MRTASLLAVTGLTLVACATRPNRTEPKWAVAPNDRAAMTLRMGKAEVVSSGEDCSDAELNRAKNLINVLERELYDAGFEIEAKDTNVEDALDVTVEVGLLDCRESLLGDLGVRITKGEAEVLAVAVERVVFSNLRVGANLLVDRILETDALLGKPPMITTTTTTSTTTS